MLLVHLRPRRPHGGTAAGIQQAELDADGVGHFAHDAAQGVDLAHQVALGDAADGGVAGHLRDQVEVHGDHGGPQAQARAGARGFAPGMAGADDHDVVLLIHLVHCYHCIDNENTALLASGGREHALAWKLAQSAGVRCSRPREIRASRRSGHAFRCGTAILRPIWRWPISIGADLTVVGPEAPLVAGVVDAFRARGQRIVGPDRRGGATGRQQDLCKELFPDKATFPRRLSSPSKMRLTRARRSTGSVFRWC